MFISGSSTSTGSFGDGRIAGRLGIQISGTPRGPIDVKGSAGSQGFYVSTYGTAVYLPTDIAHSGGGGTFDLQPRNFRLGTTTGGPVSIYPRFDAQLNLGTTDDTDLLVLSGSTKISGSSTSTGSFGHGYIDNKLGINTTTPQSSLEVFKTDNFAPISFHDGYYGYSLGGGYIPSDVNPNSNGMSLYMSSTQIYLDGLHGNTRFVFRAGGTEKFQITGNNVLFPLANQNISGSSTSTGSFGAIFNPGVHPNQTKLTFPDSTAHFESGYNSGYTAMHGTQITLYNSLGNAGGYLYANHTAANDYGIQLGAYYGSVAGIQLTAENGAHLYAHMTGSVFEFGSPVTSISGSSTSTGSFGRLEVLGGGNDTSIRIKGDNGSGGHVNNGNTYGIIDFDGLDDNGDYITGAQIKVAADSPTGAGDMPSRIQFFTRADGGSLTEAYKITDQQYHHWYGRGYIYGDTYVGAEDANSDAVHGNITISAGVNTGGSSHHRSAWLRLRNARQSGGRSFTDWIIGNFGSGGANAPLYIAQSAGMSGGSTWAQSSSIAFYPDAYDFKVETFRDLNVGVDDAGGNLKVYGDITATGDIIAENYIVSSSTTYMTTSFSAGSTAFGDSQDDTHQFTGSLNVTGSVFIEPNDGDITTAAKASLWLRGPNSGIKIQRHNSTNGYAHIYTDIVGTDYLYLRTGNTTAGGIAVDRIGDANVNPGNNSIQFGDGAYTKTFRRLGLTQLTMDNDITFTLPYNRNFIVSGSEIEFTPTEKVEITGNIEVSGEYSGNISGSSTSTGSFGKLESTTATFEDKGLDNYHIDIYHGDASGSKIESQRELWINSNAEMNFITDANGGDASERIWRFASDDKSNSWEPTRTYFKISAAENSAHAFAELFNNDNGSKVKLNSSGDSYFMGGDIGIGTTSPDEGLHLKSKNILFERASYDTGDQIQWKVGGNDRFTLRFDTTAGGLLFYNDGIAQNHLFLDRLEAHVGIGTTTPTSELTVQGDISASGDFHLDGTIQGATEIVGNLTASGSIMAKGTYNSNATYIEINPFGSNPFIASSTNTNAMKLMNLSGIMFERRNPDNNSFSRYHAYFEYSTGRSYFHGSTMIHTNSSVLDPGDPKALLHVSGGNFYLEGGNISGSSTSTGSFGDVEIAPNASGLAMIRPAGGVPNRSLKLEGSNSSNASFIRLRGPNTGYGSVDFQYGYDQTNSYLSFQQAGNERVRFSGLGKITATSIETTGLSNAGGNISGSAFSTGSFGRGHFASDLGIGTTSPSALIHGTGTNGTTLRLKNTSSALNYIHLENNANTGNFIQTNAGSIALNADAFGSSGDVRLMTGNSIRFKIDSSGHALPGADNTYNLGSSTARWANIHSADLHLSNEDTKGNEVDGTTGNWTIQEGEDDLYLLNRKNGKKYRFKLEEIK